MLGELREGLRFRVGVTGRIWYCWESSWFLSNNSREKPGSYELKSLNRFIVTIFVCFFAYNSETLEKHSTRLQLLISCIILRGEKYCPTTSEASSEIFKGKSILHGKHCFFSSLSWCMFLTQGLFNKLNFPLLKIKTQ